MSHAMRINQTLWDAVEVEAAKRIAKPTHLVLTAIRRELGLESAAITTQEVFDVRSTGCTDDVCGPEDGEDSGDGDYSPLAGNVSQIRLWQAKLEQAQTEHEGYRNGVSEDDWDLEQRSDYVVDCVKRIEEAKLELHALVPAREEG